VNAEQHPAADTAKSALARFAAAAKTYAGDVFIAGEQTNGAIIAAQFLRDTAHNESLAAALNATAINERMAKLMRAVEFYDREVEPPFNLLAGAHRALKADRDLWRFQYRAVLNAFEACVAVGADPATIQDAITAKAESLLAGAPGRRLPGGDEAAAAIIREAFALAAEAVTCNAERPAPDSPPAGGAPLANDAARGVMPSDSASRKGVPLSAGVLDYFPAAFIALADLSKAGNDQHNAGAPLHWSRDKSTDHDETLQRHFAERGAVDTDGRLHRTKMAWRALAALQLECEARGAPTATTPRAAVVL